MPTNMPGGKLLSGNGGYLNVLSPYTPTWQRLDVAYWEIDKDIRLFRKGHSGTYGIPAVRKTGEAPYVDLQVWWDLANPPEQLLRQAIAGLGMDWGCGLQLGLGSAVQQAAMGVTPQRFYLLPSGILGAFKVLDSSEAENDDIVVADCRVYANASPLFLIPEDNNDYVAWAAAMSAKGQFSPWAGLSTMQ